MPNQLADTSTVAPYFHYYLSRVTNPNTLELLKQSRDETFAFLQTIPEEKGNHAYEDGKWTVKEVIQHLSDCERVFQYRALCFARNDKTVLVGFDENVWGKNTGVEHRSIIDVAAELKVVRNGTIELFKGLSVDMLDRTGYVGENQFNVRALIQINPGHELHHLEVIKERYL